MKSLVTENDEGERKLPCEVREATAEELERIGPWGRWAYEHGLPILVFPDGTLVVKLTCTGNEDTCIMLRMGAE